MMEDLIAKARLYDFVATDFEDEDGKLDGELLKKWVSIVDRVMQLMPEAEQLLDVSNAVYFIQNNGAISVTISQLESKYAQRRYGISRGHIRPVTCGFVATYFLLG